MRILIDHGDYYFRNIGDSAMLSIAVKRLTDIFPTARIFVVARDGQALQNICPTATPLSSEGKRALLQFPDLVHKPWRRFKKRFLARLRRFAGLKKDSSARFFAAQIAASDLVVAAGGGYLCDEFSQYACSVLRLLALAKKMGRPVVMFGQGIGPVTTRALEAELAQTLPQLDLICLREAEQGGEVLRRAGVHAGRSLVTGDDAIEIGYRARQAVLGRNCGINIRSAAYSAAEPHVSTVSRTVTLFAEHNGLALEPLPVSRHSNEDDARTLARVFAGRLSDFSGGAVIRTADDLCRRISLCRVVVTGSYHAGVFALAQGIPVVALAGTSYYFGKFSGLAHQFHGGVAVVDMSAAGLEESLTQALHQFWGNAEELRPALLQAAEQQVRAGLLAYKKVQNLVGRS